MSKRNREKILSAVETYLREIRDIRRSRAGVPETSYYPPLANLLNEVGKTLKPKVKCIINPANRGAGIPDGGLFTPDQVKKATDFGPGLLPARGVLEVKAPAADVVKTSDSDQVNRYFERYRQVLVTNLWDFQLVGRDADGTKACLERFRLAESEDKFWELAQRPAALAQAVGDQFLEYLRRVMLQAADLTDPEELAWLLASYAREALLRVESRKDVAELASLREGLEEALGMRFEGAKGEHFFRSTLVQTLFYGLFASWVLWSRELPPDDSYTRFNWREAAWSLHVPMIAALYDQVSTPGRLGPLDLVEVLDWAASALNRVNRKEFFARFDAGHAVQYFYEPFLQAFDPALRKDLGVWYTPPEIVEYMVERVDRVLREELGIADGLADPQVYVLDPCCGTGAYLVAVLKRIEKTLRDKGADALLGQDVKRAAMARVFGFEILPAPFVVAHLQLGMLLRGLNAPLLRKDNERAGVYLTNALTGWEPPQGAKQHLRLPELEAERDAAEEVKRDKPILVILGNPPYNAFAGTSPEEEQGLVEPYKEGLISKWGIKKFNLDDLYVRFFRLAERRIAETTGRGVVCYISNGSWVTEPSFVVLREHLLRSFDSFWIENMHGNRKISEYAPDGQTSETIFAIPGFSVGIQQGVMVSLWAKTSNTPTPARVLFRDDIHAARAADRRAQLLHALAIEPFNGQYQTAQPSPENKFSFRPQVIAEAYKRWPKLTDLCAESPSNGLMEKRGGALMDMDRNVLARRMRRYFDPSVPWEDLQNEGTGLTKDAAGFKAATVRKKALVSAEYQEEMLHPYALRPFDQRFCYYSQIGTLWNRPRPPLWAQCWEGNSFLLSRVSTAKLPEGLPVSFASGLFDDHFLSPDASGFPLRLKVRTGTTIGKHDDQLSLGGREGRIIANLSAPARRYLAALGAPDPDSDPATGAAVWLHALALACSPAYLTENADGVQKDWPRIPLPASREVLLSSAALGRRIADLLDPDTPVPGITSGQVAEDIQTLAAVAPAPGITAVRPEAGHLEITAGWGYVGKEGVIMPGRGRLVERPYSEEERGQIEAGARARGLDPAEAFKRLGSTTCDVYLNEAAYWKNIPAKVWEHYIGGYQVIKKWLSYREKDVLGRGLSMEEVRHVTATARRLAALRLLEPDLDRNYMTVKANTYEWPGPE